MDTRDTVELTGASVTFIPMGAATRYSLVEWDARPGAPSPPVHVHHKLDEGFYVTSGRFGFLVDGVTIYASPGAHVLVPMGQAHTFWNAGAGPARCLIILSPPGFEEYFRELAPLLVGADSDEAAMEARRQLSTRYDIEVVGPPIDPSSPP